MDKHLPELVLKIEIYSGNFSFQDSFVQDSFKASI